MLSPACAGAVQFADRLSTSREGVDGPRLLLDNVAASARLEGQELPEEDEKLAAAYLAGEIDATEYRQRILQLVVAKTAPPEPGPV